MIILPMIKRPVFTMLSFFTFLLALSSAASAWTLQNQELKIRTDSLPLIVSEPFNCSFNGISAPLTSNDLDVFSTINLMLQRAGLSDDVLRRKSTRHKLRIELKTKRPDLATGSYSSSPLSKGFRPQVVKPEERTKTSSGVKSSGTIKVEAKFKYDGLELFKHKLKVQIQLGESWFGNSDPVLAAWSFAPIVHFIKGEDSLLAMFSSADFAVTYGLACYVSSPRSHETALHLDRSKVISSVLKLSYDSLPETRMRFLSISALFGSKRLMLRVAELLDDPDNSVQLYARQSLEAASGLPYGSEKNRWASWIESHFSAD